MRNLTKAYFDLIDLIEQQEKVIKSQNEVIIKLLNENAEKENMIKEMIRDE
jgi:hypothetical protein